MKIEVQKYEPPVEKTYITTEHFFAVDKETNIALRVVGDKATFQAWSSMCDGYTSDAFIIKQNLGVDINVIQALFEAYNNRGK